MYSAIAGRFSGDQNRYVMTGALGIPSRQRRWFAVLLGQGSKFAFVVFSVSQMADVLEPEWAKSLTLGGHAVDGGNADFSGTADAYVESRDGRTKRARWMKSMKSSRGSLCLDLGDLVR